MFIVIELFIYVAMYTVSQKKYLRHFRL